MTTSDVLTRLVHRYQEEASPALQIEVGLLQMLDTENCQRIATDLREFATPLEIHRARVGRQPGPRHHDPTRRRRSHCRYHELSTHERESISWGYYRRGMGRRTRVHAPGDGEEFREQRRTFRDGP